MGSATALTTARSRLHSLFRAHGAATEAAHRPARRSVWLLALAVVALAAACVPPENPNAPNPAGLTTTLRSGAIDLEWATTLGGTSFGYEVQFTSATTPWTTFATTTEPWVSFTDVTPLTSYSFRVRDGAAPGAPAKVWSPQVTVVYVEPKLPVLRIDTTGRAPILDRENYVRGTFHLDPNGHPVAPVTGAMGIRGRGNSTWVGFEISLIGDALRTADRVLQRQKAAEGVSDQRGAMNAQRVKRRVQPRDARVGLEVEPVLVAQSRLAGDVQRQHPEVRRQRKDVPKPV